MADYYEILGVSREATDQDIKTSYRKLAMKYHPDRNQGDPAAQERFKEITAAYQVLSNPEKKRRYDMGGEQFAGFGGGAEFGFDISDALNIFMNAFGGGMGGFGGFGQSSQSGPRRGNDLKARLPLTLEEIYTGVKKTIKLSRHSKCPDCGGTGAEGGGALKSCSTCAGRGQVRRVRNSFFGQQVIIETCPDCEGRGKIPEQICNTCKGKGVKRAAESVEVPVPPGVRDGNYVVVDGKGDAGQFGGPSGRLIVVFREKPHDTFTRNGDDLVYIQPITFAQAALGAKITVPGLRGEEELTIPPGTQWGTVLSIKNAGMPKINTERFGDLLVQIVIVTPKKLSKDQRKVFEDLAEIEDKPILERDESLLHKLKDFLGL